MRCAVTVFARSDYMRYAGRCGTVHERPVVDGAPVSVWALACPMCELELASDPGWSVHADLIPRTADETRRASKLAEEGTSTMHKVAEALALNAAKILSEQQQGEAEKAARMAVAARDAETARVTAAAKRAAAEQAARMDEAVRVSDATVDLIKASAPVAVRPVVAERVTADPVTRGIPDFPVEVHPSRHCTECGGQLTRAAHSTGRWATRCAGCRKPIE
jgi:hypothetical protein